MKDSQEQAELNTETDDILIEADDSANDEAKIETPAADDDIIEGEGNEEAKPGDDETDEDEDTFEVNLETASPADDTDDVDIPDDAPDWARNLREQTRETKKRARAAEKREKALQAQLDAKTEAPALELGKEPQLEDFDYEQGPYNAALRAYDTRKRAVDAEKAKADEQAELVNQKYQTKLKSYHDGKTRLALPDYDEGESIVREALSVQKQNAILMLADDPAVFILALSQNPKQLEAMSKEDDLVMIGNMVGKLEVKMNNSLKSKPRTSPVTRVRGGNASAAVGGDKKLEQLKAQASQSGDYSAYYDAKRAAKNKD